MVKFNLDSKTLSLQIPSGLLCGFLVTLVSHFVHVRLLPTNIPMLIGLIVCLDSLHLFGRIDFDISNLCQRQKARRQIDQNHPVTALGIYLEEHLVFLLCLFTSILFGRLFLFPHWNCRRSVELTETTQFIFRLVRDQLLHSDPICNSSIISKRKSRLSSVDA